MHQWLESDHDGAVGTQSGIQQIIRIFTNSVDGDSHNEDVVFCTLLDGSQETGLWKLTLK